MTGTPDHLARAKARALKKAGAKPMAAFLYEASRLAISAGESPRDSALVGAAGRLQRNAGAAIASHFRSYGREQMARAAEKDYGIS